MKLAAILFTAILTCASVASAQDVKTLQPGQTVISLSATEEMQVQQDVLQGSLRIEIDGKDAKDVQDKINKAMQTALAGSKDYKDVKTSTGQYYVYSYDQSAGSSTPKGPKAIVWKGNQTIDLSSKNAAQVLELSGKIQEMGFVMNNLNYTLSSEQAESFKDTLIVAALKKVQARADVVAKALGKSGYELVEVNVDNSGPIMPQPVMFKAARMSMAADAGMAAPVAQSGEQTVSLSVTARILLKP